MDPRDREAMYGLQMQPFLQELKEDAQTRGYTAHFTTAREMVNILLAACDGRTGDAGDYRDYRLRLFDRAHAPAASELAVAEAV
jgi:hypothetical protein